MAISSVSATTDTTATSTTSTQSSSSSSSSLTQVDYMLLLTTELQYQDPTEPMDVDKLTEQTCMFSQLETTSTISEQLTAIQTALGTQVDPVSYLGKDVIVEGKTMSLTNGKASDLSILLGEDAASVYVDIYDSNGAIVQTLDMGQAASGEHELAWDGTLANGEQAPDGQYVVDVRATTQDEAVVSYITVVEGSVVSTATTSSGVMFTLDNGTLVNYTDILEVSLEQEAA